MHLHSGGHSAKLGEQLGGIDRGDVFACCKPNRGNLVGKITWSVCFAPRNTSCLRLFVQIREFLKRRTLATLATTAHLFVCV